MRICLHTGTCPRKPVHKLQRCAGRVRARTASTSHPRSLACAPGLQKHLRMHCQICTRMPVHPPARPHTHSLTGSEAVKQRAVHQRRHAPLHPNARASAPLHPGARTTSMQPRNSPRSRTAEPPRTAPSPTRPTHTSAPPTCASASTRAPVPASPCTNCRGLQKHLRMHCQICTRMPVHPPARPHTHSLTGSEAVKQRAVQAHDGERTARARQTDRGAHGEQDPRARRTEGLCLRRTACPRWTDSVPTADGQRARTVDSVPTRAADSMPTGAANTVHTHAADREPARVMDREPAHAVDRVRTRRTGRVRDGHGAHGGQGAHARSRQRAHVCGRQVPTRAAGRWPTHAAGRWPTRAAESERLSHMRGGHGTRSLAHPAPASASLCARRARVDSGCTSHVRRTGRAHAQRTGSPRTPRGKHRAHTRRGHGAHAHGGQPARERTRAAGDGSCGGQRVANAALTHTADSAPMQCG
ncbi:hypothetical protein GGX14DRAFT_386725 [Mycena pura]|uniref:Uncharacterized protein n=1 Tax=Mycena pura TaxID=153505 RepID=A0AAD6YQD5_9AGAR|nr:hypothetical protein GGX14DRAFT_386725 [Mycena pura]